MLHLKMDAVMDMDEIPVLSIKNVSYVEIIQLFRLKMMIQPANVLIMLIYYKIKVKCK